MTLPTSSPEAMLAWLGESKDADEVADKLRELGVKGGQSEACHCPIAEALRLAGAVNLFVVPAHDHWTDKWSVGWTVSWTKDHLQHTVPLPPVLVTFAANFDDSLYPDLILEQAS